MASNVCIRFKKDGRPKSYKELQVLQDVNKDKIHEGSDEIDYVGLLTNDAMVAVLCTLGS